MNSEGLGEVGLEEVLYLAAGCFEVSVLGFLPILFVGLFFLLMDVFF